MCKECQLEYQRQLRKRHPERWKIYRETYKNRHPERHRRSAKNQHLRRLYNITIEEFESALEKQGNVCFLCKTDHPKGPGSFHVDHCHTHGQIRALLCTGCNLGLGAFKDDPSLLRKAAKYVEEAHKKITKEQRK